MSLIIYTTGPLCGLCNALKTASKQANIPYQEASLSDMPGEDRTDCILAIGYVPISAPLVRNGDKWLASDALFEGERLRADWQERLGC